MSKQRSRASGPPSRNRRTVSRTSSRAQQRWLIVGIVGVVVLVFAAVLLLTNNRAPATDTTGLGGADPKALGPADATVVVKDYSDFT